MRWPRQLVAAALLVAGLGGCLGSDSADRPSQGIGAGIGTPVRLVDCRDWRSADPRERSGTVEALRKFASGPVGSPAGHGRALDDDDAYELFDSYCKQDFASHFKLYKLYTRAAAFGGR